MQKEQTRSHLSFARLIFIVLTLLLTSPMVMANVVKDPSFEAGTKNWKLDDNTIAIVNSPTRSGNKALKLKNVGNGVNSPTHNASQTHISGIVPGREYIYTVWVRGNGLAGVGTGGKPLAIVRWRNSANNIIRTYDNKWKESFQWAPYGTYGYRQMKMALQAPSNATKADIMFRTWWGTTDGVSYWDDVSLTPRDLSSRGQLSATYQAEKANLRSGGKVLSEHRDYTGSGYYDVTTNGAFLQWNNVAGGGKRVLSFRYSWEGREQNLEVFVNGVSQGARKPLPTGRRGIWASDLWTVNLPAGNNTIRLKIGKKGAHKSQPMIDKLEVYNPGGSGNQAPILSPIGAKSVEENQTLTVAINASDADGPAPLLLTARNLPPGASFTDFGSGNGQFRWTPVTGAASSGPYNVTFTATEDGGAGQSDSERVAITVIPAGGGGGGLTGSAAVAPTSVNLTRTGNTDWIHWGLNGAVNTNRKAGVTPQISDYSPVGSTVPWLRTNMPTSYAWNDGSPTASISAARSAPGIFKAGKGLRFTVPAGTTPKTLRVYVGTIKGATGRFEARLSDGSAPAFITQLYQASGQSTRVVTLNFQAASPGQTLTVRYIVARKDNPSAGSITLEAAALE